MIKCFYVSLHSENMLLFNSSKKFRSKFLILMQIVSTIIFIHKVLLAGEQINMLQILQTELIRTGICLQLFEIGALSHILKCVL